MKVYVVTRSVETNEGVFDDYYLSNEILGVCKTLDSAVAFANKEARVMVEIEKPHYDSETAIGIHGGELKSTEEPEDGCWMVCAVEIVNAEGVSVLYSTYVIQVEEVRD